MSDSGAGAVLTLIVIVAAGLGLRAVFEVTAKRHHLFELHIAREEVLERANNWFSRLTWADAEGPGDINKRRRTTSARRTYTLSISVDPVGAEGGEVELWLYSAERAFAGLLNAPAGPALQILRLRRRFKALAAATSPPLGQSTQATLKRAEAANDGREPR